MLSGNLYSGILRFAIPLMLTNILQLCFNAADMIVVGRFSGKESLAAIGSTSSIIFLLINAFIGISIGANIVSAQLLGEKNYSSLKRVIHTAMTVSILSGLILAAAGNLLVRPILGLMDSPPDVIEKSVIYLKVYFAGMPVIMVYNFAAAILRAFGDTGRPLKYLAISGMLNVFLNIVFVTVLHLDTFGVGLATVISQALSAILTLRCLMKLDERYCLKISEMKICKEELLLIVKLGLPSGIQQLMFSVSNIIVQSAVNSYGSVVMAASTASSNVENITYLAMNSFQFACISFVGQNYGAGNYPRILKIVKTSIALVMAFGIVLGYASIYYGKYILQVFTKDTEVLDIAVEKLTIICSVYFFSGIQDVFSGSVRGLGYAFAAMINAVIGVCGIRIIYLLTYYRTHQTFLTLMRVYPVSFIATATLQGFCFIYLYRKIRTSNRETDEMICI